MVDDVCRLYRQIFDTIGETTAENHDLIQPYNKRNVGKVVSPTLTTRPEGLKTAIIVVERNGEDVKARRLTPRECYRLMGVDDMDIDKIMETGMGDSRHWKLAGNSIVVDCIGHIFRSLFMGDLKRSEKSLW